MRKVFISDTWEGRREDTAGNKAAAVGLPETKREAVLN